MSLCSVFARGSKLQRLTSRSQFQAVLAGSGLARTAHFALHQLAPSQAALADCTWLSSTDVCLGALVPKRWAKRAVTRNAIRRQIYAVSRAFAPGLLPAAHVVRLRASFVWARSASSQALKKAVRSELQQLFSQVAVVAGAPKADSYLVC